MVPGSHLSRSARLVVVFVLIIFQPENPSHECGQCCYRTDPDPNTCGARPCTTNFHDVRIVDFDHAVFRGFLVEPVRFNLQLKLFLFDLGDVPLAP